MPSRKGPSAARPAAVVLPKQERSRESLKRFVGAATTLLERDSFGALTINALAGEAGFSVGAFYARFQDKDALLDYLDADAVAAVREAAERYAGDAWKAAGLPELLREVVVFIVRFHRARRGVLRAVWLRSRAGEAPTGGDRVDARWGAFQALIASRRKEITHPSPEQAVPLALLVVLATVRERILFSDSRSGMTPLPDNLLADELTGALISYLCP